MKKLVAILLLAVIGFAAWHLLKNDAEPEPKVSLDTFIGHPDPSDATFYFEDGPVTLKDGRAESEISSESPIDMETLLTDRSAFGDLNGDNKEDAAVILTQTGTGAGIFTYVAAYLSGPVNYSGSNTIFLGDRIDIREVSVNGNAITISFMARGENESLAAEPTVLTEKTVFYRNGELHE